MAVTQDQIRLWIEQGLEEGATHVVIVVDTFDWTDYPVYVKRGDNVLDVVAKYNDSNTQKVMEVYNLSMPIEPQLKETRAFHY